MSGTLYGMWGDHSSSWLTSEGKILAHTNEREMAWLLQGTCTVKPLGGFPLEDVVLLKDHPHFAHIRFPLVEEDFRDG